MAKDASNHLSKYAKIESSHLEKLGEIRHWSNLSIAFDENYIWLKGFLADQFNSVAIKSIPNINRYYSEKGKLYPIGSLLPFCNEPSFLWTPILRGIKVELPNHNHHFFGVSGKISLTMAKAKEEKKSAGMITSLKTLESYVSTAPFIRLQNIQWVLLNANDVFLLGTPILPITGETYWKTGDFLLPAGFEFDLVFLTEILNTKLNSMQLNYIIWDTEGRYFAIDKLKMRPLTISSLRLTKQSKNISV